MNSPLKPKRGPRWQKDFGAVFRAKNLSPGAKGLYGLLKSYADRNGHCHPPALKLAEDLNCNRKTVFAYLAELEAVGILVRHQRSSRYANDYFIQDEHFASLASQKTDLLSVPKNGTEVVPKNGTPSRSIIENASALSEDDCAQRAADTESQSLPRHLSDGHSR